MIWIIVVDNLSTLPFAKLRQENRPRKYAFARISGILVNLLIVLLFIGVIPGYLQKHPDSLLQLVFDEKLGLGYYLAGNLCGSLFTLLLLFGELKQLRWQFDTQIWKEAIKYSSPLIIVGLGGMTNDVLSRLMYRHVVNLPASEANHELGIFANIFRLALLITIMIQAFRMAAEPYFFNKSKDEDARRTYARVMKFFVIACCFMFLGVALFLDVFKWIFTHFTNPAWAEGLEVVPLLALGNIFLGIYYNLSIWYKLTNKNMMGAYITLLGAVVTIALNLLLIPIWHYTGAAIASFTCYLIMMLVSYKQGKKHYPVPYATKKLTAYIILVLSIYLTHRGIGWLISESLGFSLISGACLFIAFAWFVSKVEAKELSKLNIRLFSS
jgi:O-antigen/teichoic acid export membrane protein